MPVFTIYNMTEGSRARDVLNQVALLELISEFESENITAQNIQECFDRHNRDLMATYRELTAMQEELEDPFQLFQLQDDVSPQEDKTKEISTGKRYEYPEATPEGFLSYADGVNDAAINAVPEVPIRRTASYKGFTLLGMRQLLLRHLLSLRSGCDCEIRCLFDHDQEETAKKAQEFLGCQSTITFHTGQKHWELLAKIRDPRFD